VELRQATELHGVVSTAGRGVAILCISIVFFVSVGMHICVFYRDKYK